MELEGFNEADVNMYFASTLLGYRLKGSEHTNIKVGHVNRFTYVGPNSYFEIEGNHPINLEDYDIFDKLPRLGLIQLPGVYGAVHLSYCDSPRGSYKKGIMRENILQKYMSRCILSLAGKNTRTFSKINLISILFNQKINVSLKKAYEELMDDQSIVPSIALDEDFSLKVAESFEELVLCYGISEIGIVWESCNKLALNHRFYGLKSQIENDNKFAGLEVEVMSGDNFSGRESCEEELDLENNGDEIAQLADIPPPSPSETYIHNNPINLERVGISTEQDVARGTPPIYEAFLNSQTSCRVRAEP